MTHLKDFNDKVEDLLKLHNHIKNNDWENLCFALFLQYQNLEYKIEYLEEKIRVI